MTMPTTTTSPDRPIGRLLAVVAMVAAGASLGACRGERSNKPPRQFLPDMDDSPKNKPQTPSLFFADGRVMRTPVAGTVAFARHNMDRDTLLVRTDTTDPYLSQRDELLRESWEVSAGAKVKTDSDGNWVFENSTIAFDAIADRIPVTVDAALIARGEERFGIYCAVCHGYTGDGKGMVGVQWGGVVPNFNDAKYKDITQRTGKDGYLFWTARHGVYGAAVTQQNMPGYAHALSVRDTWAIVAYIRVLQASASGTLDEVPTDKRAELERARPAPTPTPTPAPTPVSSPTSASDPAAAPKAGGAS